MLFTPLPLSSLPTWCELQGLEFLGTKVALSPNCCEPGQPGQAISPINGIISTRELNSVDTCDPLPILLDIPKNLILGEEFLLQFQKIDSHFKQLRELVGGKSTRLDVMLFLLMQMTIARNNTVELCPHELVCSAYEANESGECSNCVTSGPKINTQIAALLPGSPFNVGVKNPWSEYIRFLPEKIPVPTMWGTFQEALLEGTSLEKPLIAKMASLSREFDDLRAKTTGISWCDSNWWDEGGPLEPLLLSDWIRLDAWYRSRSLEIPDAGEVMVPVLDMANHSSNANATWRRTSNGNLSLVLNSDEKLHEGEEVTINYGSQKGDAEYLFSYGFIDEELQVGSLTLDLDPMEDDPLRVAKLATFQKRPLVCITLDASGNTSWECSFVWYMCLNEEDGLQFRTLQEVDGLHTSLRVFWQGEDKTDSTDQFETLIKGHPGEDVFKLRATKLILDRIEMQIENLIVYKETLEPLLAAERIDSIIWRNVSLLRTIETSILQEAFNTAKEQISRLLEIESVSQYLTSMMINSGEDDASPERNEKDDDGLESNKKDDFTHSPGNDEEDDFS